MTERQEIIDTFDQAIRAHQRNLARAELKKAQGDTNPSAELDAAITYASREIDRLQSLKARMGNNNGRVTQKDRMDKLSAQMSEVQGQIISVNGTLNNHGTMLTGIKTTVDTIQQECPLFRADMEEGVLTFVRNPPDDISLHTRKEKQ